jgi:hypothetical protein
MCTPNTQVTVNAAGMSTAITAATVKDTGGAHFHYDRRGQQDFYVAGNYMMSSFTWRKY